jgi:citrate-Mg2+:H+ or citrate-Ca2+:H+ symporter, CitMHS family
MFIFAILYFGIVSDAGMFDPIIDRVLRVVGSRPAWIVAGTALLAMVVHLDGSGATTILIVVPAMLPLYEQLGMDRRLLACAAAMAAGVMNTLPWGGPTLRAAAALNVPVTELFNPLVPVVAVGIAFVLGVAYLLGRREGRRLGPREAAAPRGRRSGSPVPSAMEPAWIGARDAASWLSTEQLELPEKFSRRSTPCNRVGSAL